MQNDELKEYEDKQTLLDSFNLCKTEKAKCVNDADSFFNKHCSDSYHFIISFHFYD
eukprot:UN08478